MAEPVLLLREQILTARDITQDTVEVPEWGGAVRIRSFTKRQQAHVQELVNEGKGSEAYLRGQVYAFIEGVIEPKFEESDFAALAEKSAVAMDRVLRRLMAISGVTEEAVKDAAKSFQGEP